MQIQWHIVKTVEEFAPIVASWPQLISCDVETALDTHLLGISLSDGTSSVYVPLVHYTDKSFVPVASLELIDYLRGWLPGRALIGHNFTYDKRYIDNYFNIVSDWAACTRIMWHLSSAPAGPRPYGLKDAQKEILGWENTNEKELDEMVRSHGGKLSKGDHYLADLSVLAKYACLDAYSTFQLYRKLEGFFIDHDYGHMLDQMMQYNLLLEANTRLGVAADSAGLQKAHDRLVNKREAAHRRFLKLLEPEITSLEEDWKDRKSSLYKREYNRIRYLAHPEEWERFNPNSDKHKRELFYDKLAFPVVETTEKGLASASAQSVAQACPKSGRVFDAIEAYLTYEKANTLSTNFSGPYLSSLRNGRLHPGFNICGTVSYRLSGFKPYLLNAPFDEKLILKNLKCDEGYVGVHADLSAIEPTLTAHYSEDPTLLKVFRDGLGDIYLDLALDLFPNDKELQDGYNSRIPITGAVKERFSRQRKIAKVIQLAVQYTGTKHTVAKNLSKYGIPTTVEEADVYVRSYWRKFRKVAEFNYRLREINRKDGLLRNVIGRIIRVPDPEYKDLSNRFIQSSAHDVLVLWVLQIYKTCRERGVEIRPILLDCHDSTSNQCPVAQKEQLKSIYNEALNNVVDNLGISVKVKCETKYFSILAGLKGED